MDAPHRFLFASVSPDSRFSKLFSLKLLGGASLEGPGGPVSGSAAQRRRLGLLAFLAASPERGVSREKLVAYLWPEKSEERARHALSDSVYRLNAEVGGEGILATGTELRLNPAVISSDLQQFRDAIGRESWDQAVALYAGAFLDGFSLSGASEFERWVESERTVLGRQYAAAVETVANRATEANDLGAAITAWNRLAIHDPYNARYAIGLMKAMAANGNRIGALKHARIYGQFVEQEFGTQPDPQVTSLADRLRDEQSRSTPGAKPIIDQAPDATAVATKDQKQSSAVSEANAKGAHASPLASRSSSHQSGIYRVAATTLLVALLAIGWFAWDGREGSPSSSARPRIAVLPMTNLGQNEDNRYFADGVTEDILTHLARVPGLIVVSSTSLLPDSAAQRPITEIGAMLDVDYILRGSVRRENERVRITAQLLDARRGGHVWADSYDRRLQDIFAVQGEIATKVADALNAEIVSGVKERIARPPTDDLVAYNLYLRGRYLWHRRTQATLLESVRYFSDAVARDSGFARAWAGLADAYSVLAFYDYLPPGTTYPKAKAAARRALELDPHLAEAHASLGYIALYYDWEWSAAEDAFKRAISINPSYTVGHQWYANHLVAMGRFDEAEREMIEAREVNPLSLIANGALGWVYFFARKYEAAVEQCNVALEMDADWDLCYLWRGQALVELGKYPEAITSLERAVELSGRSGISVAALAHAQATSGDTASARALLDELAAASEYRPSYEIAKGYLALGERERALEWLERAFNERAHSMAFLRVDPQLKSLEGDARFERLVAKVGLH